jgi:hypothetical protein
MHADAPPLLLHHQERIPVSKTSLIRTAIICTAGVAAITAFSFRPQPNYDPLAQRLAICGDTPEPYSTHNGTRTEVPRETLTLMVKLVDDCRQMLLEHPEG